MRATVAVCSGPVAEILHTKQAPNQPATTILTSSHPTQLRAAPRKNTGAAQAQQLLEIEPTWTAETGAM